MLKNVLLIDDDEAHNYLHAMVITRSGQVQTVEKATTGMEALDLLTQLTDSGAPLPELIFLDINMPKMNGWEFLDAYRDLLNTDCSTSIVVMLTTSMDPDFEEMARKRPCVLTFLRKPLTADSLQEIMALIAEQSL